MSTATTPADDTSVVATSTSSAVPKATKTTKAATTSTKAANSTKAARATKAPGAKAKAKAEAAAKRSAATSTSPAKGKGKAKAKAGRGAASTMGGRKVAAGLPASDDGAAEPGGEDFERFVEAQRVVLLTEREAYTRSADSLRAEAEELAQDREPGDVQFDEESGEGDSMNVERERDLALSAQALASVEEIDRALAKIERGTYGVCEKCGERIPSERLQALPHAALCVRCKSGGLSRR